MKRRCDVTCDGPAVCGRMEAEADGGKVGGGGRRESRRSIPREGASLAIHRAMALICIDAHGRSPASSDINMTVVINVSVILNQ